MRTSKNRLQSILLGCVSLAALSLPAHAEIIKGTVKSGAEPIQGAIVRIEGTDFRTSTQSDGGFRFANVTPGEYTLRVEYIGAAPITQTVTVAEDTGATVALALPAPRNLVVRDDEAIEVIAVAGQTGSLYAGIAQQRASDTLISVLSADALGQFPDQNVAEAARRISGVSVANDQGEGRFVIIRGLDPALNATSVNGVRIPAPEFGTRAVALDVIDADVLQSVTIQKSLTPDLDGDGIGGSVNIKTLSAFDTDGMLLKLNAEGIYSDITEQVGEKFSVTASKTFLEDKLGVAGSVSWNRRPFGSDNRELDGGLIEEDGIFYPEELELRDYIVERRRISGTLNFDVRAWENHEVYLRTLYNSFRDAEERLSVENEFEGLVSQNGNLVRIGLDPSFDNGPDEDPGTGQLRVDRRARDRTETQRIFSIQLGGQSRFNNLTLDYSAAYSHAEEEEPNRIENQLRAELAGEDGDTGVIGYNVGNLIEPTVRFVNPVTSAFFNDAANYEFDELEFQDGITEEDEYAFQFDARYDTRIFGYNGFFKAGAKARLREKSADILVETYDGFDGNDITLAQFPGSIDFPLVPFGPVADVPALRAFFDANRDSYELDPLASAVGTFSEDYESSEDIFAGYVMGQVDVGPARITAGVRVEHTDFTGNGFFVTQFEDPLTTPTSIVAGDETEGVSAERISASQNYTDVLPSINVKYEIGDDWIARAAYYGSIARPSIFDATPAVSAEFDGDSLEGDVGNPGLDRQQANNVDLALEYYPSSKGVLNFGLFYKDIKNFFASQTFQDITFNGGAFDEATRVVNLSDTSIFGIELSYQQSFEDILPGPWGGLVFGTNYTFVDSEAFVGDGEGGLRKITAPLTSKHIANMVLGYERYGLDMRFSVTYRSDYLDAINEGGEGIDRFIDNHVQLDLVVRYNLNDHFQVNAQVVNINNQARRAVLRGPGFGSALSQFEEYGVTGKIGFRYTY